jgi:hypothetical protein
VCDSVCLRIFFFFRNAGVGAYLFGQAASWRNVPASVRRRPARFSARGPPGRPSPPTRTAPCCNLVGPVGTGRRERCKPQSA